MNEVLTVMENKSLREKYIERNYLWAQQLSWESRAKEFLNKFILPNESTK